MSELPDPPRAPRRPRALVEHGDERRDDWYWLRDRDDPATLAYLEAENAYCNAAMAPLVPLADRLFDEIRGRILETDVSVPVRHRGWEYSTRTVEGLQYGIHCRRAVGASVDKGGKPVDEMPEVVLLDENVEAEGHEFFEVGAYDVSFDHRLLAWSADYDGREVFTLHVRDLENGVDLPDTITDTYYGVAWAADHRTLFYTRPDDAMRPYQVWRHVLGTPTEDDALVFEEPDEHFTLSVDATKSKAFVLITLESKTTSEAWVLDATQPLDEFCLFAPRRHGVEYSIDHDPGDPATGRTPRWVVLTNERAENFRLAETPLDATDPARWRDVVPHRPDVRLDGVEVFRRHLVLAEREAANDQLRVLDLGRGDDHVIEQPEEVYSIGIGANPEIDTTALRFEYTSLVTPRSVFDYDLDGRTRELRKQQPVLGGYEPSEYETFRLWAPAPDGERVPVSVVCRRGLPRDGSNPCLLYGYGAYEISIEPAFSALRLSLLDRGLVFAIAHIRGGGELGRRWYDNGKLLRKRNTFTDFIACAEHLVSQGLTRPDRLGIRGGSAGGMLVGATINMRPDLFAAVIADVPFVDSLTTMLDDSLPLTVGEWEEWGDPHDVDVYAYLKSYSPYDNVAPAEYPALFVTAGLNDPRVSYWEPAKWVARLRAVSTGENPILLKTQLGAGHGGPSGRYDAWREEALLGAFLLHALGVE